jgi:hypothetical protein
MIRFNTGYGNKSGMRINLGTINNTGARKITGIEFKTGYGYVSGKRNKAG